ncbi:hypothetical protein EV2_008788 [Malus domestica]
MKATWSWSTVSSFTVLDDGSETLAIPTEKEVNNKKELEGLSGPMRKDVSQEKEYRDAQVQLITKLKESGQFGVRVGAVEPALTKYQSYKIWAYLRLGVQPVQTLN